MPPRRHQSGRKSFKGPLALIVALLLIGAFVSATLLRSKPTSPRDADAAKVTSVTNSSGTTVAPTWTNSSPEPVEPGTDVDRATAHLRRGNALLAAEKFAEAVAEFQAAAKLNPEDEDTFYNLGLALARSGKVPEAIAAYEESLKLYPDYVEAHNNLGNLLVKSGDMEAALSHFKTAVDLDPTHALAQNNLGNTLARRGQYSDALAHFEKALELKPDYLEAQANAAHAYLFLKRTDEAVARFSQILTNHPAFEPARRGLARALQQQAAEASLLKGSKNGAGVTSDPAKLPPKAASPGETP